MRQTPRLLVVPGALAASLAVAAPAAAADPVPGAAHGTGADLLLALLAGGAALVAGVGGWRLVRFLGRRRAARRRAVAAADLAAVELSALRADQAALAGSVARLAVDQDGRRVRAARRDADRAQGAVKRAAYDAQDATDRYPQARLVRLSLAEAGRAAVRWEAIGRAVTRGRALVADATTGLRAVADALDALPGRVERLAARHRQAGVLLDRLRADGWRVDTYAGSLATVAAGLDRARDELATGARGPALDTADTADERLTRTAADAAALPDRRRRVLADAAALRDRLPGGRRQAREAAGALATLREIYDGSCWQDLVAPAAPDPAVLDAAEAAASMRVQDWDGAEKHCAEAAAGLDEVTAALAGVTGRAADLARLAAGLPEALATAAAAVAGTDQIVARFARELPPRLHKDAKTMRAGMAIERRLAGTERPPLLRLGRSLPQVVEYAEDLAGRAAAVHELAATAAGSAADARRQLAALEAVLRRGSLGTRAPGHRDRAAALLAQSDAAGPFDYGERARLAKAAAKEAADGATAIRREQDRRRASASPAAPVPVTSSYDPSASYSGTSPSYDSSPSYSSSYDSSPGGGSTSW